MSENATMTRREMLQRLGLMAVGAAAGCTPVRIALHKYPGEFDRDADLTERTLASFVDAAVPGATGDVRARARVYADEYYPFAPYRGFFAADLCRRSMARYGEPRFDALSLEKRSRVIRDGLEADGVTQRLYSGAIFLAQISQYAGIYDDEGGSPLLGFGGSNTGFSDGEISYANPTRYLPAGLTADGNYH
jgi:hypothetical protein